MIAALFCGLFYGAFVLSAVQEMERIRRRELVKRIKQALETCPEPDVLDAVNWSWETFFDCRGPEPHNCTCDPCTCHGPEMSVEEATERIEEALRDMSRYYYVTGTPDAPFDIHKATHTGYEDG